MISICIPIFNQNITQLVNDLHSQAELLNVEYEILLFDDCSSKIECKIQNSKTANLSNVVYRELGKNIGRSAIRNLLAKEAKFQYIIFMDCDTAILKDDYLKSYIAICQPNIVCYGGRKYVKLNDGQEKLRWLYGVKRESNSAATRSIHPNRSFITFNFLIDKNIFTQIKFDESLKTYGHEDTLFGLELANNGITVKHINNELANVDLEEASLFISKTEDSIRNLLLIRDKISLKGEFVNSVKLLRVYSKIKKYKLVGVTAFIFSTLKKLLLGNLTSNHPSLISFDFYKLGYLCKTDRDKTY